MDRVCDDCEWFEIVYLESGDARYGFCNKNPPQKINEDGFGVWPKVLIEDWCGSFKKKGECK